MHHTLNHFNIHEFTAGKQLLKLGVVGHGNLDIAIWSCATFLL